MQIKLNPEDRAVFQLVMHGVVNDVSVAMYPRAVSRLMQAGLIVRQKDGVYVTRTGGAAGSLPPPSALTPPKPRREAKVTLGVRIPEKWVPMLDKIGPDRSKAARDILGRALEGKAYRPEDEASSEESGTHAIRGRRRAG
jgi:hypothetical protein